VLLALTTSLLLYLSYFPVACGWLAWVGLTPLLALARSTARPRVVYLSAWLGGLALYLPVLQWLRVADPRMYFTWAFLAAYCALYFPLALYLIRRLGRGTRLPLVLTAPAVWVALEFFRANFGPGFSWYLLGHTQHDFLPVIQMADLTGAYGVSFLVVAVNALLAEVLYARGWFRGLVAPSGASAPCGRTWLLGQGVAVLAFVLAALAYGGWRLGQEARAPGPRLALVQGNVPQQLRNQGSDADDPGRERAVEAMVDHFERLSDRAAAYRPDLIVWPETSYPFDWTDVDLNNPADRVTDDWRRGYWASQEQARYAALRWHTAVLLGMNARVLEGDGTRHRYNSAVLVDLRRDPETGRVRWTAGRYDKIYRVPLGEYVPLRDWLPWLNRFAPYDFDYSISEGRQCTRFPLTPRGGGRGYVFGVVICYEDTNPDRVRPYAGSDGRPPADFVLNLSNDGWFDGTSEHEQHLAICRFRAVECRRAVARAVNMGISAVVDGNGRVLRPVPAPTPEQLAALLAVAPPAGTAATLSWPALALNRPDARVWAVPPTGGRAEELPVAEWGAYKKVSGVLLAAVPLDRRDSLYARWGDWLPWACWALVLGGVAWSALRRRV
jgi:apolipoprotein N-acyltransferase